MSQDKTNFSNTPTRDDIIAAAREYIGTPFRHQGRTKSGIDCVGLIILAAKARGLAEADFDFNGYARRPPHGLAFIELFKSKLQQKSNMDVAPGDVVIFKESRFPCHCGITAWKDGVLSMIHAYAPYKMVVEDYFVQGGWPEKHVATFAFPGVAEWQG